MAKTQKEADEMTKNKAKKNSFADEGVPLYVKDGMVDIAFEVRCLSESIECVGIAVSSGLADSNDFIEGALHSLLQATEAAYEVVSKLSDRVGVDQ